MLTGKPGKFLVTLDRSDAAEGGSSFHGTYCYRLRLRLAASGAAGKVGLDGLRIVTFFENGIMSIPQIFDGDNTIRFQVEDPSKVEGDLIVRYIWQDAEGEKEHRKRITPEMFYKDNEAVYHIEAPGLERCRGLVVSYP